jgi:hypothetical protein
MTYRCCRGSGGGHPPPLAARRGPGALRCRLRRLRALLRWRRHGLGLIGTVGRFGIPSIDQGRRAFVVVFVDGTVGTAAQRGEQSDSHEVVTFRSGRDAAQAEGMRTRGGQRRPVLPRVHSWSGGTASRSLAGCCPRGRRPPRCDRPRPTGGVRTRGTADRGAGCAPGYGASQEADGRSEYYRSRARVMPPQRFVSASGHTGRTGGKGADTGTPRHLLGRGCRGAQPWGVLGSAWGA